jgi:hypothetical protein
MEKQRRAKASQQRYRATPEGREANRVALARRYATPIGREAHHAYNRKYRSADPIRTLWQSRDGATLQKGIAFGVTLEECRERFAAMTCEVTGMIFDWDKPLLRPSMDRRDRSIRTYSNNWQATTLGYNFLKGVRSDADVLEFLAAIQDGQALPWTHREFLRGTTRIAGSMRHNRKPSVEVELGWVRELCAPMQCAATKKALRWDGGARDLLKPSPDRINGTEEYQPGNVRITSLGWNLLRNGNPDKEAHEWLRAAHLATTGW